MKYRSDQEWKEMMCSLNAGEKAIKILGLRHPTEYKAIHKKLLERELKLWGEPSKLTENSNGKKIDCKDCGKNTLLERWDNYSVNDIIWEFGNCGEGHLCLRCLEKRVGRPLILKDFIQYGYFPVNDFLFKNPISMHLKPAQKIGCNSK